MENTRYAGVFHSRQWSNDNVDLLTVSCQPTFIGERLPGQLGGRYLCIFVTQSVVREVFQRRQQVVDVTLSLIFVERNLFSAEHLLHVTDTTQFTDQLHTIQYNTTTAEVKRLLL